MAASVWIHIWADLERDHALLLFSPRVSAQYLGLGQQAKLVPKLMSDRVHSTPLTCAPFFFIKRPHICVNHAAQDRGLMALQADEVQSIGEGELGDPFYHLLEGRPPGGPLGGPEASGGGRGGASRRHEPCAQTGGDERDGKCMSATGWAMPVASHLLLLGSSSPATSGSAQRGPWQ